MAPHKNFMNIQFSADAAMIGKNISLLVQADK
jgi:hypothetical protein